MTIAKGWVFSNCMSRNNKRQTRDCEVLKIISHCKNAKKYLNLECVGVDRLLNLAS